MIDRLRCPHDGTPLQRKSALLRAEENVVVRRRDCPRCGASYRAEEKLVATIRPRRRARGVPAAPHQEEARP